MNPKKFRPLGLSSRFRLKVNRISLGNSRKNYNWQNHDRGWWPAAYQLNHKTLSKQFMRLHYLAAHAPQPIRQRWAPQYLVFKRRHFADPRRASGRFIDNYTAERWI